VGEADKCRPVVLLCRLGLEAGNKIESETRLSRMTRTTLAVYCCWIDSLLPIPPSLFFGFGYCMAKGIHQKGRGREETR